MSLLQELRKLKKHRKSMAYYAQRLGVSINTIKELNEQLVYVRKLGEEYASQQSVSENLTKGTMEMETYYDHPPTAEEILRDHNMEDRGYVLSSYYSKAKASGWLVTALFSKIESQEQFSIDFQDFIKTYKPKHTYIPKLKKPKHGSTLLINKQDFHANKYDIMGNNDITERYEEYLTALAKTIQKAGNISPLEKIVYVIGSDLLNSEFTGGTSFKDTKQQNLLPYRLSFQYVCDREVNVINYLLSSASEVEIIFLGGNHDAYAGWHVASWLKAYCRTQKNLQIDITSDYTKFRSFYDSAVCLNHGDVQKPEKLVANFPVLYKEGFAKANSWYVITGDQHHEASKEISGVKWYQVPLQSKAQSDWDSRNGYTTSIAEIHSFLFEPGGLTATLRQRL